MVKIISAFCAPSTFATVARAGCRAVAGATALLVLLTAQPVLAADPPAAPAQVGTETTAGTVSESSGVLESITVTAQKRAENIQTVPISIAAVTSATIENAHTVTLEALTGVVPNVQIGHFSNNPDSAVFNIRGMGVIEPDPYAGQTVTVVVDGVPQFFNMISLPDLFDVERIEILRGPQGTLFGANTTGGVVNIITEQPTGNYEGKAVATIGNRNRMDGDFALNFPLIPDVLAGKVSFLHHSEDGFVTNVVNGQPMGNENVNAMRAYLKYTPNADFNATLIAEYDHAANGSPIVVQGAVPGEAEYVPAGTILPGDAAGQYPSPCVPAGHPCRAPRTFYSASTVPDISITTIRATTLTMNWHSPIGDLTSITAYKSFLEDNYTDQDGTVLFLDATHRVTHGYQMSEELRDSIKPTSGIQLIFGGFVMYDHYQHEQNFLIQFAVPGFSQINLQNQGNHSESLFAQGFFDLTDKLRFQAGLRGTRETTDMTASLTNYINPSGVAAFTGNNLLGGFTTRGQKSWTNVGGKTGLDYKWTPDTMSYIYYARGFKSGGFVGRVGVPSDIGPYNPEYVDTVEAGLKSDWLDHRLRTNAAVFYNKYRDLQLAEIYFTNGGTTQGNTILNAAQAKTEGVELEVQAAPIDNLKLNASIAYLYAKYTKFNFVNSSLPGAPPENLSGRDLQDAPHVTASGGFSYTLEFGPGRATLGMTDRYTSSKFEEALNDTPRATIQATNYVDGTLDWTPTAGKWSAGVWVRNIADKHYIASVYDSPGTLGLVNYAPPREFGATVRYNW
jgi:iron complex outermembrane receptor protein